MQWAQQISGQTARVYFSDRTAAFGVENTQDKTDGVHSLDADKAVVSNLLKALEEAQKTSKSQTVQDLRDKLNEVRKKLGEEKFKAIIEALKKDASDSWLAFLKALFPELFADDESPSPPAPPDIGGGGGGGGGGRVNPENFGPSESMSNKPITEGAKYHDYRPDKSVRGKKPDNIWSGFSQGYEGNCTTVSSIKAAMQHFGQDPKDVFKNVELKGNTYEVEMHDGFKLKLTKDELRMAAREARFKGDDPTLMTNANFMYAASAKRAQMEGNSGSPGENDRNATRSFKDALISLNDGEHSREGLHRLGLKDHYRPGFQSDFARGMVGTYETNAHSMAVIGNRKELWGGRGGAPGPGIYTVLF